MWHWISGPLWQGGLINFEKRRRVRQSAWHASRHSFCCRLSFVSFLFFCHFEEEAIKIVWRHSDDILVSDVPVHLCVTSETPPLSVLRVPGRSLTCCPRSAGCRPLVPSTTCPIATGSLRGCRGASCSQTRRGEPKAEGPLRCCTWLCFCLTLHVLIKAKMYERNNEQFCTM